MVGVNYAQSTVNPQLYTEYETRLTSAYQSVAPSLLAGTENFYDAVYYLLYSVAAAVAIYPPPTAAVPSGADIATALMGRVISPDPGAVGYNVGPGSLSIAVPSLTTLANKISLTGTMGPPDFDRATGTRNSPTSLWCVDQGGPGVTWWFEIDAAYYDPTQPTKFRERYNPFPCIMPISPVRF
jgi:hypothetical protein